MAKKRSSPHIISYRRPFRINVGLLAFLVILVYVLISLFTYLTSNRTEVYEVRTGVLTDNLVYQGIVLRQESVVNSDYTGTVNYYNKEGDLIESRPATADELQQTLFGVIRNQEKTGTDN